MRSSGLYSRRVSRHNAEDETEGMQVGMAVDGNRLRRATSPNREDADQEQAMSRIIEELEKEQLREGIPDFSPGDTVVVQVRVKEGSRERLQAFEGVVIAKRTRGLNSAFTVRKVSHGEGVERVFQSHSPSIASVTVKRRGDVRRAKLYYLRQREGKAARIREKV